MIRKSLLPVLFPPSLAPCTEAAAFLSRTSNLDARHIKAYTYCINTIVAAGTFAKLDGLYILATINAATAHLNLVGSSNTLTYTGTPGEATSFTVDRGLTGDGSTVFYDTGIIPNAGGGQKFTQNSASIGAYCLNRRTASNNGVLIGAGSGNYLYIQPLASAGNANVTLNAGTFPNIPNSEASGLWGITRNDATNTTVFKNNSAPLASAANASTGLYNFSIYIGSMHGTGDFTTDTVSAAFVGGGLTNTDWTALSKGINGYHSILGINNY